MPTIVDLQCSVQVTGPGRTQEVLRQYYDTWAVSFKAKWGLYSKKLLKELERRYYEHQQGATIRRKSKVPSQGSTTIPTDEGLLIDSGSNNEGSVPAAAGSS